MSDSNNNNESRFQVFIPFPFKAKDFKSNFIMVSKDLTDGTGENGSQGIGRGLVLQKYLMINHFIDSLIHHYFYLASPSNWDDPFETKYLEILNSIKMREVQDDNDRAKLNNMSIFCSCMTCNDSINEEASWKEYSTNIDKVIRVTYDFEKLCMALNLSAEENIYIAKLNYQKREEMDTLKPINRDESNNNDLDVLFVNNFCLKQDAYQFENELRICKVMKGEQYKSEKGYKIKNIDFSPAILRITLPPINHNLKYEEFLYKKKRQIKKYLLLKSLLPDVPIHVSNLYDTNKKEMTSELFV